MKNARYGELAQKYPNITIFPGDRNGTGYPATEKLPDGGERYIVTYRLLNGCHACELVGSATVAFDFDGAGRFSGRKFLAVEKAGGGDIKTDKEGERGDATKLIVAGTKVVALAQSSGSTPQMLAAFQQASPPAVDLSPDSLDFGDQVVKKSSPPERITVTNVGGKQLYINIASIRGDNWKDFTISKDTCTGATIAPGKSCIIDVNLTPGDTEDRSATLVLKDSAPDSPQHVSLTGKGVNSIDVQPF